MAGLAADELIKFRSNYRCLVHISPCWQADLEDIKFIDLFAKRSIQIKKNLSIPISFWLLLTKQSIKVRFD